MFSSFPRRGARRGEQEETAPPPSGQDSYYGVRSLNGSVNWSPGMASSSPEPSNDQDRPVSDREDSDHGTLLSERAGPSSDDQDTAQSPKVTGLGFIEDTPAPTHSHFDNTPIPLRSSLPDPLYSSLTLRVSQGADQGQEDNDMLPVPASPDETLHPLEVFQSNFLPPNLLTLPDLRDEGSVPSSPASLTSLPSYLSSLSRASSPISGVSAPASSPRGQRQYSPSSGENDSRNSGIPEDLVLPTLNLPSSSLHLSLEKWEGPFEGIRVALLGGTDSTRALMRALREKANLVELDGGLVGLKTEMTDLSGEPEVCVAIFVCDDVETIRRRAVQAYSKLNSLLNPHLPRGSDGEIRRIARDYSRRNDWVHAAYVMEKATEVSTSTPLIKLSAERPNLAGSETKSSEGSSAMDDPTPMPFGHSAQSYFPPLPSQQTPAEDLAQDLLSNLIQANSRESESIEKFMSWRQTARTTSEASSMEGSMTSHSSNPILSSPGVIDTSPMPTVAKAGGGGEWEAGMSRRVAAHLQRGQHDRSRDRGRGRRRPGDRVSAARPLGRGCLPLFPIANGVHGTRHVRSSRHLDGLRSIWSSIFFAPGIGMNQPGEKGSSTEKDVDEKDNSTKDVGGPTSGRRKSWIKRFGVTAAVISAVGIGWWMMMRSGASQ